MAHSVRRGHIDTAGQGMRALDHLPGLMLVRAVFCFFARMPANGRRIEEDLSALEGRQAGRFRIPLIPANEDADTAEASVKCLKAQIAGSEIVFFVIEGIIGDVHLAKNTEQSTVGVEHGSSVVINPRSSPLEQGSNDHR